MLEIKTFYDVEDLKERWTGSHSHKMCLRGQSENPNQQTTCNYFISEREGDILLDEKTFKKRSVLAVLSTVTRWSVNGHGQRKFTSRGRKESGDLAQVAV